MSEDADAVGLSRSYELMGRALGAESGLRRRTEGLTWMLWGFVLAGIFLMYGAMGELSDDGALPWWSYVLWVPWVLAGSAFTWTLWRTAALSMRNASPRRPAGAWVTLAWIAAILGGFALLSLAPASLHSESLPLVAVGLAWLLMGALGRFHSTREGRFAVVTIGASTALVGLALGLLLPAPEWHAADAAVKGFLRDLLSAGVAAGVPLLVGAWQALRG